MAVVHTNLLGINWSSWLYFTTDLYGFLFFLTVALNNIIHPPFKVLALKGGIVTCRGRICKRSNGKNVLLFISAGIFPVFLRRNSDFFMKEIGKIIRVVKSRFRRNFRNGQCGGFEQSFCVCKAEFGEILPKGFSGSFLEKMAKIR